MKSVADEMDRIAFENSEFGRSHRQMMAVQTAIDRYNAQADHSPEAEQALIDSMRPMMEEMSLSSGQQRWDQIFNHRFILNDAVKRIWFSSNQKQLTLDLSGITTFLTKQLGAEAGFLATLFTKNLQTEFNRAETAALREAVAAASPEWRKKWRERESLLTRIAEASAAGKEETVRSLLGEYESMGDELRSDNQAYADALRSPYPEVAGVRRALRPGEALLEFVRFETMQADGPGEAHFGVFIVKAEGGIIALHLGLGGEIDRDIESYRRAVNEFIVQWKSNLEIEPRALALRLQLSEDPATPGVLSETRTALASAAIRQRIWDPISAHLAGVERVYIAPDGTLGLIPFEALAKADDTGRWRYLAEDFRFVYLDTGRDLIRLNQPATTRPSPQSLLVGNPAFSLEPHQLALADRGLAPGTPRMASMASVEYIQSTLGVTAGATDLRAEIPRNWPDEQALGDFLNSTRDQLTAFGRDVLSLQGPDARKTAVLAIVRPRLLQLATHGYTLDKSADTSAWDNPLMRSMLLFSGVNRWSSDTAVYYRVGNRLLTLSEAAGSGLDLPALASSRVEVDNGVLTAYEVTGLDLRGTELVSLTACETGVGEVTPDGVASLRQAFLLAGARSVTTSLWEVPTDATLAQTKDFYQRWLSPETDRPAPARYEAFRAAQLAALDRARQEQPNAHPFFWAGTVYAGDPGDLPENAGHR